MPSENNGSSQSGVRHSNEVDKNSDPHATSKPVRQLKNYFSGLGAGVISSVASFPLDVVRTKVLFGVDPFKNVQNGFGYNFFLASLKNGLVWPIQKNLENALKSTPLANQNIYLSLFISGAVGNIIPGLLFNPLNVIKVRYMENEKDKSFRQIVSKMYRKEGLEVFKKGLAATVLRDFCWGSIYFPLFQSFKTNVFHVPDMESAGKPGGPTSWEVSLQTMKASCSAAALATLATTVLDSARLWEQRTADKDLGAHRFLAALKLATAPTKRNLFAVLTGLVRVTLSTGIGHLTYVRIQMFFDERETTSKN